MTNNLRILLADREQCVQTIIAGAGNNLCDISYTRQSSSSNHGTIALSFTTRTSMWRARRRLGRLVEDCGVTYHLDTAA